MSKNGNNLKLSDASGNTLGEFKNGNLLPEKYDFDPVTHNPKQEGVAIGEPVNGYQIYKHGDYVSVRRIADESAYSSSQLNELGAHSRAHVLERHGHDVTDDALVKRANDGIVPDGSTTFNGDPPPYSSKFETPERPQDALESVGPNSVNWNPPATGNTYPVNYPATGQASTTYGYGIPAGGNMSSSVQMFRIKAIYKRENGVWKLLTMYPQI